MDKTIGYIPMIMLDDIQVFPNSNTHFSLKREAIINLPKALLKIMGRL